MCDFFQWDKEDFEKQEARGLLKDALTQQFNSIYGTDVDSIQSWQTLCQVLRIVPMPEGLHACREAVRATHVNIVDLVENRNSGRRVRIFSSEEALSEYTIANGKFFPKENAYAGGLLRFLLRQIMNPSLSN